MADGALPQDYPQNQSENKPSGLAFLEVGVLEVFFVIVGLLIIFGVLNYFNILPISQSFPFLSFLPKQEKPLENKTQIEPQLSQEEINKKLMTALPFLGCPVEKESCAKGIVINEPRGEKASFSAVAFSGLSENEPILAVIDGNIKFLSEESTQAASTMITIENRGRNIIATYELPKGSFTIGTSSANVKEKEIIGTLTSRKNTINEFGKNFNLILYSQAISSKTFIKLKPAPNGASLLNSY